MSLTRWCEICEQNFARWIELTSVHSVGMTLYETVFYDASENGNHQVATLCMIQID